MERIEVFGDKFKVRKTYDIVDSGIGRYGFEVYNEGSKFLFHLDGEGKRAVIKEIKRKIYKEVL